MGTLSRIVSLRRVKIQGFKKPFYVRGLEHIPEGAEITSGYLIKRPSGYYIVLYYWRENKAKHPKVGSEIGLDFGVKHQVVLSNGLAIDFEQAETKRLKRLQRSLSRKVKGSNNWRRTLHKLRREHEYVTNIRRDAQKKVLSYLWRFGVICYQKDNIKGWKRLCGKKVHHSGIGRIKSALNDAETAVSVDAFCPTTQTCSACGYVLPEDQRLGLADRVFICPNCGLVEDRDLNAARSILNYGLATLNRSPCGGHGVTLVEMVTAARIMDNPIIQVSPVGEASNAVATATA